MLKLKTQNNRSVFVGLMKVGEVMKLAFEDAKKIFKNAKKNFADTFTVEQQRAILHSLIKKIVLQGDEIQIYWRFE